MRQRWGRAWEGFSFTTLRPEHPAYAAAGRGALVVKVAEGSPATAAKLRPGDVIVAADGRAVGCYADLAGVLIQAEPGQRVVLRVSREGAECDVELVLTAPPGRA